MTELRTEPTLNDRDPPTQARRDAPRADAGRRRERVMIALGVALLLVAVAVVISMLWPDDRRTADAPEAPALAQPAPGAGTDAAPPPRYPIPETKAEQPPLDMSDATLLAGLSLVFGDGALNPYIEREQIARRIVATIDNLPRRDAPPAQWPVRPTAGSLAIVTQDDRTTIAEANAARYAPYVRLLESVSTPRLVEFYGRHYPLFQQAYRELGYPQGHFNDRVVEAIDVLLATPAPALPPQLVQPKIRYQYADAALESLPAGQKLMLRLGPENAKRVKAKLVDLRAAITRMDASAAR